MLALVLAVAALATYLSALAGTLVGCGFSPAEIGLFVPGQEVCNVLGGLVVVGSFLGVSVAVALIYLARDCCERVRAAAKSEDEMSALVAQSAARYGAT